MSIPSPTSPPEPIAYAARPVPPRPDVILVIGTSLLFLLLSSLLVSAIGRLVWSVDGRLISGGKLFGSVALIGITCQVLSLFGRSRTMSAMVYYATALYSLFCFGAALFSGEGLPVRGLAAVFGVVLAFIAWSHYRWGYQLGVWKREARSR